MAWSSNNEIHEHIGKFCVDFEEFNRSMESSISQIFYNQGLDNQKLHAIILAGCTAAPLRDMLQSLIGELIGTEENQRVLSKTFRELQMLIEERNNIIHSKWLIYGVESDENMSEVLARGEKLHRNKEGGAIKNTLLTKENILALINQCRQARVIVSLLSRCVLGIRTVEECFSIINKNLEVNYEALKPIMLKGNI